jgi:type II secretory pathway predicted ATPase ExeA
MYEKFYFQEFDIPRPAGGKADVLTALNAFLIDRYARRKRVLLIIDEGQNLSNKALEEVRMLSNLQSDNQSLLQIMRVGQPELIAKLRNPSMRQFSQRIAASYHLTGLDREETERYIAHRLQKAGGRPDLFTPAAVDIIYKLSGRHPPGDQPGLPSRSGVRICGRGAKDRPGHHPPHQTGQPRHRV